MSNLTLGERMKVYEFITDVRIIPRLPIIVRIDGKAFHTFTKKIKAKKPFDEQFSLLMEHTALELAKNAQGCLLTYTQSDEISMVIRTDQSEEATSWFAGRVQKICSVSSSIATAYFNKKLVEISTVVLPALFDARVYGVPNMMEVANYLVWRQRDCEKNSVSSAAYYFLADKYGRKTARQKLDKLNQKERQEILFQECGINWNNYPDRFKRGIVCVRKNTIIETDNGDAVRKPLVAQAAPIFTSDEDRQWLWKILNPDETEKV